MGKSDSESALKFPADDVIVERVRDVSGVAVGNGPTDVQVAQTVRAISLTFEFWYSRVMMDAVDQYRKLIIGRINPYIRRMQLDGADPLDAARVIVFDYESRNFVTAGGWVLESLAVNICQKGRKSLIEGVDLERDVDADLYLYVLKSGTVTRNSDILKVLKQNVRRAEQLHKQVKSSKGAVVGNYVQMTGCTRQTRTEDGIRRPSSAQFWSEITGLPQNDAIELTLAIAAAASDIVTPDASTHVQALETLVGEYMRDPSVPSQIDWEFLATRNLSEQKSLWKDADKERDQRARQVLSQSGYVVHKKPRKATGSGFPDKSGKRKMKRRAKTVKT